MDFLSDVSSMSGSLGGSMGGSCLQQRAEGYPAYVFHEPLHSLTQSYTHAHSTAHSQPHRGIPTSHGGTPTTPGGQPAGPGGAPYQPTTSTATGKFSIDLFKYSWLSILFYFLLLKFSWVWVFSCCFKKKKTSLYILLFWMNRVTRKVECNTWTNG